MTDPLPKSKKGYAHFTFSVLHYETEVLDYLQKAKEAEDNTRSAAVVEAIKCILASGRDWRLRLHEQHKPAWADEMERRLAKKLDNIKIVTTADNGPEKDENVEVEIGKGIFHEE